MRRRSARLSLATVVARTQAQGLRMNQTVITITATTSSGLRGQAGPPCVSACAQATFP